MTAQATTPEIAPVPSGRRAAFGFIFASVLMNAVSFGLIYPILPNLTRSFFGAVSAASTASAAEWQGVFGVTWGAMQFVASPILGMLSDRFGRRPVLLISICGLAADFLVMTFAPGIGWLLVGRVLSGLTAASFATANAYVADISAPDQRAKNFGWIGAAGSTGFLGAGGGRLPGDPRHSPGDVRARSAARGDDRGLLRGHRGLHDLRPRDARAGLLHRHADLRTWGRHRLSEPPGTDDSSGLGRRAGPLAGRHPGQRRDRRDRGPAIFPLSFAWALRTLPGLPGLPILISAGLLAAVLALTLRFGRTASPAPAPG